MSRIVVATWGSLGDLHPMLAVGLGLSERGHDVAIAAPDKYKEKIEQLGLGFYAIRPRLPEDPNVIARCMDPKKGASVVLKEIVLGHVRETYADLLAAVSEADYLVAHEIVYAAPLVAEKLSLRWASCALAPAAFFSAYEPIVNSAYPALAKVHGLGVSVNRLAVRLVKRVTRPWGKPLYALRKELGLPPVGNPIVGSEKYSPHLVLALFSKVLGRSQPDWPSNLVMTGFTFYDGDLAQPIPPALEDFLNAGEAPVVFTLGSAAVKAAGDFYANSLQAAMRLNCRAVLLGGQAALAEELPSSVFVCDYAPYSKIFPRARVIVHQGGVGTTAQALRAGRPTLVVPHTLDQPDNAARVERLGVSLTLPRERYSTEAVVTAVGQLIGEPRYAERAAEVGRSLQAENGVAVACDALERVLDNL